MDRRTFLKAALAVPAVAAAMKVGAVETGNPFQKSYRQEFIRGFMKRDIENLLDRHNVSFVRGYQGYEDITWVRASITLPDGREFYDQVQCAGGPTEDNYMKLTQATVEHLSKFVGSSNG